MTAAPALIEPPYPPVVLPLELLYDAVRQRFAIEGPANVEQPFGWRYVAQQHVTDRIVWVPGNPVGVVGRVTAASGPGGSPRSLATLNEYFYVIVSAQDAREPENERLQYRKTRLLRDYWHRAVYLTAYGSFTVESEEWITTKLERRFGAALMMICTIEAAVLDEVPGTADDGSDVAPADTQAVVDVTELDVTERLTVEASETTPVEDP